MTDSETTTPATPTVGDTTPRSDDHATRPQRVYTIREAADLCGMSRDAMRGRVERGSVRSVLGRDGLRRIPASELQRAGLVDHARGHDEPTPVASVATTTHDVEGMGALVAMLTDLQRQHAATLERAVAAETRLQLTTGDHAIVETALHAARAEAAAERERADRLQAELDAAAERLERRRWWSRRR